MMIISLNWKELKNGFAISRRNCIRSFLGYRSCLFKERAGDGNG